MNRVRQNTFGHDIQEMREIIADGGMRNYLRKGLGYVLDILRYGDTYDREDALIELAGRIEGIIDPDERPNRVLELAAAHDQERYEQLAHAFLAGEGVMARIPKSLQGRADLMYRQIRPYLSGRSVLDLGCGDGKVGQLVSREGYEVTLADVYRNPNIDALKLPFVPFAQGEKAPLESDRFDTTLLLTVIHHSSTPLLTVRDARRMTRPGGRVIVIESVYGIHEPGAYGGGEIESLFTGLTPEQQRLWGMYFDHFYNRVFHYSEDPATKVNVPFNFRSPEEWEGIFEEEGLDEVCFQSLGIDLPIVPEYHTLHILEKV